MFCADDNSDGLFCRYLFLSMKPLCMLENYENMKSLELLKKYNRCRICFTEDCTGKDKKCNCSVCENYDKCNKVLQATIRITNKCTQECSHCCFRSSPKSSIMMTKEEADKIAQFIDKNKIYFLNVMGGEFFCNPDWFYILNKFAEVCIVLRVVSNGDWARDDEVKEKLTALFTLHPNIKMSISKDKWHTNKNVELAGEFLKMIRAPYNIADDVLKDNGIVPIGRGEFYYSFYSSFGAYCRNRDTLYSFLIDEVGDIYKCSVGTWKYANVEDYLRGGFDKRFKSYNKKINGIFLPNCSVCRRSAILLGKKNKLKVCVCTE